MLIQNLAAKTRLAMVTVIAAVCLAIVVSLAVTWQAYNIVREERSQIYVLHGDIPFLADRASMAMSYEVEAKAHVRLLHERFFNLPPDRDYIRWSLGEAAHLCDESLLAMRSTYEEKGFYSNLISASATSTIMCDSINIDTATGEFTCYVTQVFTRKTNTTRRAVTTSGRLVNTYRSTDNPFGLLASNWRIIESRDIWTKDK